MIGWASFIITFVGAFTFTEYSRSAHKNYREGNVYTARFMLFMAIATVLLFTPMLYILGKKAGAF